MDTKDWVAIAGLVLSILTFYVGRISAASKTGKEEGATIATLTTKITYIESAVGRIETGLSADIGRLDGRLTEISSQINNTSIMAARAMESAKMVHNRLNEHLRREHSIQVVDYPDQYSMDKKPE